MSNYKWQPLSDLIAQEHGVLLLDAEIDDIVAVVERIQGEDMSEDKQGELKAKYDRLNEACRAVIRRNIDLRICASGVKSMIEAMKCCGNCMHIDSLDCALCTRFTVHATADEPIMIDKWELANND